MPAVDLTSGALVPLEVLPAMVLRVSYAVRSDFAGLSGLRYPYTSGTNRVMSKSVSTLREWGKGVEGGNPGTRDGSLNGRLHLGPPPPPRRMEVVIVRLGVSRLQMEGVHTSRGIAFVLDQDTRLCPSQHP